MNFTFIYFFLVVKPQRLDKDKITGKLCNLAVALFLSSRNLDFKRNIPDTKLVENPGLFRILLVLITITFRITQPQ